jgi:hypothetical protein
VACHEKLTITCACGRLGATVPCLHGAAAAGSEVEADLAARRVPCDDVCASVQRAKAFGDAIGAPAAAAAAAAGAAASAFPDALLLFARDNPAVAAKAEAAIREVLQHPEKYGGGGAANAPAAAPAAVAASAAPAAAASSAKSATPAFQASGNGIDLPPGIKTHRAFVHQVSKMVHNIHQGNTHL